MGFVESFEAVPVAHKPPVPGFVTDALAVVFGEGHFKAEGSGVGFEPLECSGIFKAGTQVVFRGAAVADVDGVTRVVFAVPWRGADFGSLSGVLPAFCFNFKKYVLLVLDGAKARYGGEVYALGGRCIGHFPIFGCCRGAEFDASVGSDCCQVFCRCFWVGQVSQQAVRRTRSGGAGFGFGCRTRGRWRNRVCRCWVLLSFVSLTGWEKVKVEVQPDADPKGYCAQRQQFPNQPFSLRLTRLGF